MEKRGKTIFREILIPLLSVLAFEMLFMAGVIVFGGVIKQLDRNAADMLAQQTENRGNYLLSEMTGNWANLELLSDEIDSTVQGRIEQGKLTLDDLNENSPGCIELLQELSPSLADTMYNKKISGIFVIFYTKELREDALPEAMPGVYLRDLDPASVPSERNADLLWERAPGDVVRSGYIATDSGWKPTFSRQDSAEQDFFRKPYLAARKDGSRLPEKEYGYWTTETYSLTGDGHKAIAYSVPLIMEDGTVYGVLGIELLTDYVQSLLPDSELLDDGQGAYLLAVASAPEGSLESNTMSVPEGNLKPVAASGGASKMQVERFRLAPDNNSVEDGDGEYYGSAKRLILYSNNALFDSDQWYLLGVGTKEGLFSFSRQIQRILFLAVILTFVIGLAGILWASYKLSKPIHNLSQEVEKAQRENTLPVLPATGIYEIDRFAESISRLGREVVESSTRLLSIMDLASVELAGYEMQKETNSVYVTENYFPLLGVGDVDSSRLTLDGFLELQKKLHESLEHLEREDGSIVYSVPQPDGSVRYLRHEHQEKEGRQVGLIEDVTASMLEKLQIEKERDSDGLTRLYARRGFKRIADMLFLKPEVLKQAGLLMIDLDNLKAANDRFGHNFGDLYIQAAGRCFVENTPENTLCARMSGDEFILFFYGYDSQDEVREKVKVLYEAIGKVELTLPNGGQMGLSASGGIAWYPQESMELSELMKYADFAMYQVKQSIKGKYREFDVEIYRKYLLQNQSRAELYKLLEKQEVNYFFQPIFNSQDGTVYAYEALMRVNMPTLRSPDVVLRLAKEEGRMHDIEKITLFCATECYRRLLERGAVPENALLFINSIANECMTPEEEEEYRERFHELQGRIVVEIMEAEHLDMEILRRKSSVENFSGMFALDDYGSGYNSEITLLELNPKFIKLDISIVRDVDQDINKQQIIRNIVDYAHRRKMMIVAEGMENSAELQKILELGVDLLQGYYLARPGEIPLTISREALRVIENFWREL